MTVFDPDGQGCLAQAVQVRAGRVRAGGAVDAALPWIRAGLALAPQRGDAWHLLGDTLLALGRFDEAFAALKRSLRAAPGNPAPTALLAEAAAHRGRFALALAAGARWAALAPGDPAPCDWLAGQYWRLGWLDRMRACRRRAALLAPGDAARAAMRTEAEALVRRWEEAAAAPRPIPLDDVAFLIPFRLDFPERLRNLRHVLAHLTRHFRAHVLICEDAPDGVGNAAAIFAGIDVGESLVAHSVVAGNQTPFSHKSWQINQMVDAAETPFVVVHDVDTLLAPERIILALERLRAGAALVRPFSGVFVNASWPPSLNDDPSAGEVVHPDSVGGAMAFNRAALIAGGGYNEWFLSYGYEDDEIVARLRALGADLVSVAGPLRHLDHPRAPANSAQGPMMSVNRTLAARTAAVSRAEIEDLVRQGRFRRGFVGAERPPDAAPAVVARLAGGLGNQMFQYAAARALAVRHGVATRLDLSGLTGGYRRFGLDAFAIDATIASPEEIVDLIVASAADDAACGDFWRRRVVTEPHFQYAAELADVALPALLCGHWQSWRYFADCADLIRRDFTLVSPPTDLDRRAAAAIAAAAVPVAVHVRRGDYVSDPEVRRVHGAPPPGYHQAGVARIAAAEEGVTAFVFTDDPEWARESLRFFCPTVVIDRGAEEPARDLALMALCRHHVIANSSFGWWGAWLAARRGERPAGRVIAPRRWFADPGFNVADLFPPHWELL